MEILASLIENIASAIDRLVSLIPGISLDNNMLSDSINFIKPYWNIANIIFPVKETLVVLGILCAFSISMFIFWSVQRAINLLRGAG